MGQRVHCHPVFAVRFYRHQAQKVEFLRYFEKHARMMLVASLWRMYCPGRVAQRDGQLFSVHDLVLQPRRDSTRKLEFAELSAEPADQLRFEFCTVKPGRSLGFVSVDSPALHEQPLARVERGKFRMALSQCRCLVFNIEQLSDEFIEVYCHFDKKLRFLLAGKRGVAVLAERFKLLAQRWIGATQKINECRVQLQQAVAAIEVLQPHIKSKFQLWSAGKINTTIHAAAW